MEDSMNPIIQFVAVVVAGVILMLNTTPELGPADLHDSRL